MKFPALFVLGFIIFLQARSQSTVYQWSNDACDYMGTFDPTQITSE